MRSCCLITLRVERQFEPIRLSPPALMLMMRVDTLTRVIFMLIRAAMPFCHAVYVSLMRVFFDAAAFRCQLRLMPPPLI